MTMTCTKTHDRTNAPMYSNPRIPASRVNLILRFDVDDDLDDPGSLLAPIPYRSIRLSVVQMEYTSSTVQMMMIRRHNMMTPPMTTVVNQKCPSPRTQSTSGILAQDGGLSCRPHRPGYTSIGFINPTLTAYDPVTTGYDTPMMCIGISSRFLNFVFDQYLRYRTENKK